MIGANAQQGEGQHNGTGQEDAGEDGEGAFFEVHVQDAGGQHTGPGTGAGQRNAHKQEQRPIEAPSGLGFQLSAALFPFLQAPGKEATDVLFILSPFQHLAGKQIDEGDRNHIADNSDDDGRNQGKSPENGIGNGSADFDERNHGDEQDPEVLFHGLMRAYWRRLRRGFPPWPAASGECQSWCPPLRPPWPQ